MDKDSSLGHPPTVYINNDDENLLIINTKISTSLEGLHTGAFADKKHITCGNCSGQIVNEFLFS